MSHKYQSKRLLIVVSVCCLLIVVFYTTRKYPNPTNIGKVLINRPLPQLNGGPEYNHRKPYNNPQYKSTVFYTGPSNMNEVALTFDDGPDTIFTPKILDILKQNNIKATFFIVGTRAQAHPEIVKRILNEGHAIGNHSWDHPDLDLMSSDNVKSEIQKTDDILFSIIGYHPSIVRPPYGAANKGVIKEISSMGYKIIDWSVDTLDWAGTPTNIIMNNVKKELRPGAIILQHSSGGKRGNLSNTVAALPEIIQYLKSGGYKFVKIPELLNISPTL